MDAVRGLMFASGSPSAPGLAPGAAPAASDWPAPHRPEIEFRGVLPGNPFLGQDRVPEHTDRPASPSHASRSRSGHRTTARRPQCDADGVSRRQAHSGLQTRVILISPRSGGLKIPLDWNDSDDYFLALLRALIRSIPRSPLFCRARVTSR